MFLMLAIHVPLSLLVADTCLMVDDREIDISSVFPDDHTDLTEPNRTVSNAIKTCLCDENFISTFGKTRLYSSESQSPSRVTGGLQAMTPTWSFARKSPFPTKPRSRSTSPPRLPCWT